MKKLITLLLLQLFFWENACMGGTEQNPLRNILFHSKKNKNNIKKIKCFFNTISNSPIKLP